MKIMRYTHLTALLTIAIISASGCSGSRWLSRRDYSKMHDPFAESPPAQVADSANGRDTATGRASLSGSDVGSSTTGNRAGVASLDGSPRGPKPIQSAQLTHNSSRTLNGVTQATYPENGPGESQFRTADGLQTSTTDSKRNSGSSASGGPSLSDFIGKQSTSTASAATLSPAARMNSADSTSTLFTQGTTAGASGTLGSNASTRTTAATDDKLDAFDQFVQSRSQTPTAASPLPEQNRANASPVLSAFGASGQNPAVFPSSNAGLNANAAANQGGQGGQTPGDPFNMEAAAVIPALTAAASETRPVALFPQSPPLQKPVDSPGQQTTPQQRPSDSAARSTAAAYANPFADLDPQQQPSVDSTAAPPAANSPSAPSAPSSFEMDSGWKPAQFTRP